MLTIIAWVVFVYASFWNILFWTVDLKVIARRNRTEWKRTCVEIVISFAIWIIPGVYLFGMF